jgi:hypothetical protein
MGPIPEESSAKSPSGIGGWLILPLLGLIITPFKIGFALYADIWPAFSQGAWRTVTTPGNEGYHPLWVPLLIIESAGNVAIIAVGLIALWYFLRKSRSTAKLMVSWLGLILVMVLADYVLMNLIPELAEKWDPKSLVELVRPVLGAAIWIPYFLFSKRVKATFTN